jgi:hypothetical protein
MSTPPAPNPALKDLVLPVGWNALANLDKKTALVIGEYRFVSEAKTALTLLTAKTEADLLADIAAKGLSPIYPPKKK